MNELQTSGQTADDSSMAEASRELMKKLVIKLRWMGMEDEARRVQRSLCQTRPDGVPAPELETD